MTAEHHGTSERGPASGDTSRTAATGGAMPDPRLLVFEHMANPGANPQLAASLHGFLHQFGLHLMHSMGDAPSGSEAHSSDGSGGGGGSGAGGKFQGLLHKLRAADDEALQLSGVMELCELLSMGTEETLNGFRIADFVLALVPLLQAEHNADLMLFASRAITYMIEALPASAGFIANNGMIVEALCLKLLTIEYIDLAEQSLTALEKLSQEHGLVLLQAGCLSAALGFIDFFSIALQRAAVTIASNICRVVPREHFHLVRDNIPILSRLLTQQDKKVDCAVAPSCVAPRAPVSEPARTAVWQIVERSCLAFARLIDNFCSDADRLQEIASHGLCKVASIALGSIPLLCVCVRARVARMLADRRLPVR